MKKFFVGIKAVIVNDGRVLLVKKANRDNFWELPGGRIDGSETIEEALHRELSEELPTIENIKIHEIVGAYRVPHDIKDDLSLVLVFYKVSASFNGDVHVSDEHDEYQWVTPSQAAQLVIDDYDHIFSNL